MQILRFCRGNQFQFQREGNHSSNAFSFHPRLTSFVNQKFPQNVLWSNILAHLPKNILFPKYIVIKYCSAQCKSTPRPPPWIFSPAISPTKMRLSASTRSALFLSPSSLLSKFLLNRRRCDIVIVEKVVDVVDIPLKFLDFQHDPGNCGCEQSNRKAVQQRCKLDLKIFWFHWHLGISSWFQYDFHGPPFLSFMYSV